MPVSKNGKFFFLYYGESVEFRMANLEHAMKTMVNNQITELGVKFFRHFSNKPFPNGQMVYPCEGKLHCQMCLQKMKPTALFTTGILIDSESGGDVYVCDMRASAHTAVLAVLNNLLEMGATFDDLTNAKIRLVRLAKGQRPWFTSTLVSEFNQKEPAEEIIRITPEEMSVLESLDAWLKMHPEVKNTHGSVVKTLREREHWSEDKISFVFETVLDERGFLKRGE